MPTKFDLGDESLSVTAKATPEQQLVDVKDVRESERVRATLPGTLVSMGFTIWFYSNFYGWAIAAGIPLRLDRY